MVDRSARRDVRRNIIRCPTSLRTYRIVCSSMGERREPSASAASLARAPAFASLSLRRCWVDGPAGPSLAPFSSRSAFPPEAAERRAASCTAARAVADSAVPAVEAP
eukprot:scaffold7419_cov210-Pinguiococcus_pyrenoidosus.AAC.2